MGIHDVRITIIERTGTRLRVQLDLWEPRAINVSGVQIEAMLFEQTWIPNAAVLLAWWAEKTADNEWLEIGDEIQTVALISGGPEQPWTDADWSILDMDAVPDRATRLGPPMVIEVTVDDAGMLAHLDPGASWNHSDGGYSGGDAFTFIGGLKPPVWKRGKKPVRKAPKLIRPPFGRLRVVHEGKDTITVEYAGLGDLPSLSLAAWIRLLDYKYPKLEFTHISYVSRHLAAVHLEDIAEVPPQDVDVVIGERKGVDPSSRTRPLMARYRIVASDAAWMEVESTYHKKADWTTPRLGHPEPRYLLHPPPKAAESGTMAELQGLVELAEMEGPQGVAEMLGEGLREGLEVIRWSLQRAAGLGDHAATLLPELQALIGSEDPDLAILAIETAGALGLPALSPALRLAATRMDSRVASAAQTVLGAGSGGS